jgi:aminoglycoside phosphotransferase (APT) family kinase protein/predicted MFS family arabinose efflux permease
MRARPGGPRGSPGVGDGSSGLPKLQLAPSRMVLLGVGWFGFQVFWAFHSATLPLFLAGLTDSKFRLSLVLSLAGISGVAVPPIVGYWSDRSFGPFGRRTPYVFLGMLGVLGCVLALPRLTAFGAVALASGLMYVCLRVAETPFLSILPDITPREQRGTASGVMNLVGSIGLILCFVAGSLIWERSREAMFALVAAASFAFAAASVVLLRERAAQPGPPAESVSPVAYLRGLAREGNAVRFLVAQFFWWLGFWMLSSFLVLFTAEELGVAEGRSFLVPLVFSLVAIAAMLPMGVLGDRLGRKAILSWMLVLWAVSGLAIASSQDLPQALVTVGLAGIPYAAVMAVGYAFFLDLIPEERTAEFVGIGVLTVAGAQFVGPLIGGALIDALGYRSLFPVAAGFQLVGLALLQLVRPPKLSASARAGEAPSSAAARKLHEGEVDIDESLVRRLLRTQLPHLADRRLEVVQSTGTVNAIFRLGPDLCVRLPRHEHWADDLRKELEWLPRLALHLSLTVPEPVARGEPGSGFPYPWAVFRWIPGEPLTRGSFRDEGEAARDLARFVAELRRIDPTGAPPSGRQPLRELDDVTRDAIASASGAIDTHAASAAWDTCLRAPEWQGAPVWRHCDLIPPNLLLQDGRLAAVLDFGGAGIGDPAIDIVPAWAAFGEKGRDRFRSALDVDDGTWARARGLALHQALLIIPYYAETNPGFVVVAKRTVREVLADLGL